MEYAFRSIVDTIGFLMALCAVFVPLGMWKAIELVWWVFHHVTIQ